MKSQADNEEEWISVTRKTSKNHKHMPDASSKAKGGKKNGKKTLPHVVADATAGRPVPWEDVKVDLDNIKGSLQSSKYYEAFCRATEANEVSNRLKTVDTVIALGLGSFSQSKNALIQLALLVLIKTSLLNEVRPVACYIYDPMMNEEDFQLCASLGVTALPTNNKGVYRSGNDSDSTKHLSVNENILYYMPHCPFRLYCNVLWDNWNVLVKCMIIGNSFRSYSERRIYAETSEADLVTKLLPFLEEVPLWPLINKAELIADSAKGLTVENAFCDTSIMLLKSNISQDAYQSIILNERPTKELMNRIAQEDVELW